MIKAAFFDVDGVLSAPCFLYEGELRIGLPSGQWRAFCDRWKEDAYRDCKPVGVVRDYVQKRRKEGAKTFVLSTSDSENENAAKRKFVNTCYEGLFDGFFFVDEDKKKLEVIGAYAAKHALAPAECELIEDTYMTLLDANDAGITATHLAHLLV